MAERRQRQISGRPMPTETPFLAIKQASFAYGSDTAVVSQVDWTIPTGAFHCLVGRSGCGKTTLLKLAAGLLQPTSGSVLIDGSAVTAPSQNVGFVFQTPSLLEWLTVLENVLLPISLKRSVTAADRETAAELLELTGIQEHIHRHPQQLSGGQQSRAALARALITAPAALLMDEPFAALDAITREELQDDLLRLTTMRQTTVLFVTHDIAEAVYLGGHVAIMDRGRIAHARPINLPRPHGADIRYDQDFNGYCHDIRLAMAAAAS
jgi:NitT/TauT family transport system ATP-binding protein